MFLIISIDIGEKNLGWTTARFDKSTDKKFDLKCITFNSGVYDFKQRNVKNSLVITRILALQEFFEKIITDEDELFGAVIERQVGMRNEVAMQLMYSVATILLRLTRNIIIFDPKRKFLEIGQQYCTKNKAHKKQSIENMKSFINSGILGNDNKKTLNMCLDISKKKDDIADSFNQLIIQIIDWNLVKEDISMAKTIYNNKIINEEMNEKEDVYENDDLLLSSEKSFSEFAAMDD